MDGNGRWARKRHLPRLAGHRAGTEPVRMSVRTCAKLGIEYLTLYTFSLENWNRPRAEVRGLMVFLEDILKAEYLELDQNGVRLRIMGRTDMLPESTNKALLETIGKLAAQPGFGADPRPQLWRARRDPGRRAPDGARVPGGQDRPRGNRRGAVPGLPLPAGTPRPGSADPHQRGAARVEFPALADRVFGDLRDRRSVARLQGRAPPGRGSGNSPGANAVTGWRVDTR